MNARNLKPDEKVAAYVDWVLVIEHNSVCVPFSLPLFANGSPTLLFSSVKGKLGHADSTHLTLFGQTIRPETITLIENFTLIAYFFKPYSLSSIFRIAPQELTDKPIDLHLLAPGKTKKLEDCLLHAPDSESMMALMDNYILGLIANRQDGCSLARFATGIIAQSPSKESLINVQKELHITERTFQRMFERNIGIAPNQYRRICQFNSAFWQLNTRRYSKLSDIAFHNGYADQSHYIRAFKEFTHITPTEYLNFGGQP